MLEMRRAVPRRDRLGHADPRRAPPVSNATTSMSPGAGSRCSSMSTSAEAVYSTVAKPWLKRRAGVQLVDQRLGHRLAGPVMDARNGAASRLLEPMLVELRGKLDEIAARRACRTAPDRSRPTACRASAWPNSWNRVRASSKLSRHGSPAPPVAKFITLTTIGSTAPIELLLVAERAHPGAAVLRGPCEIVADEQRDRRAVAADPSRRARRDGRASGRRARRSASRTGGCATSNAASIIAIERQIGLHRALVEIESALRRFSA